MFTTSTLIGGGLLGVLLFLVALLSRYSRKLGKTEAERQIAEESAERQKKVVEAVQAQNDKTLEEVEKVNEIHRDLEHDPDYAQRVQDRFSRD